MNPFEGFYRRLLAQDAEALGLAEELTRRVSAGQATPRETFLLETLRRLHDAHARCGEALLDPRFRNVMAAMRTAREKGSDEMYAPLMMSTSGFPSPMIGARGGSGFGGGGGPRGGGFGGGVGRPMGGMPMGAPMGGPGRMAMRSAAFARPPHTPPMGPPMHAPPGRPGFPHHFRPGFGGGGLGWPWWGGGWPSYGYLPQQLQCPPCPVANFGVCPTPY